jgi:hypothetical protein
MTDQLPASPGERVARLNKTDFYDWFKMNLPSRVHAFMLADAMWRWIEPRIDAAIREAVEEDCRAVCILCARRVPFVKSKLGYFLHADPTGWEQCRAAPIRRLRAALEAKSEGSAT